jgi:hypothetical protein
MVQNGKTQTIRRFGWSCDSEDAARRHAEQRVADAIARIAGGERLPKREPKVAYNGADGVPIREEVIARHDDVVITRNSYGARCLNVADVAFIDIDYDETPSRRLWFALFAALMLLIIALALTMLSWLAAAALAFVALIVSYLLAQALTALTVMLQGGRWPPIRQRIAAFAARHPHWHLRVYKTFGGARVLLMHQTFDPRSNEISACFDALRADRLYVVMCQKQQCFRARVSAKPWRIGISSHLRPRPGIWPIKSVHRAARAQWIERYEAKAQQHAVCEFVEHFGSTTTTSKTTFVQRLHDELCGVASRNALA